MRLLAFVLALLCWTTAFAQTVQQSGSVTNGHVACWTTAGVIQDCGTPTTGFSTGIGFQASGNVLGINSGPVASPYTQILNTLTPGTAWKRSNTALGGATHIPTQEIVDGTVVHQWNDASAVEIAHKSYTGTVPVVTSGSGDCGTSPVIAGNDNVGRVTVGSSSNGGHCTVTFNAAWTNKPICTVANETSGARTVFPVPTLTTLVITAASTLTAADSLVYSCAGYQ